MSTFFCVRFVNRWPKIYPALLHDPKQTRAIDDNVRRKSHRNRSDHWKTNGGRHINKPRCPVHHRKFKPNSPEVTDILRCVGNLLRVIMVLSPKFKWSPQRISGKRNSPHDVANIWFIGKVWGSGCEKEGVLRWLKLSVVAELFGV